MVKFIIKPLSPTLRPDHPKEYQVLARTNNLFYAQYVKEHDVIQINYKITTDIKDKV